MKAHITQEVTVAEAKNALRQSTVIYFSKDEKGNYRMDRRRARPICLMGPAGIGKTEIVKQIAEEQDLAFLSYSVTHHTRQSAIGLPTLVSREYDGEEYTVTEYTLSEIVAEVLRTMKESGKKEGILFLDEFNCASETLRPAMLQLLQSKSFGPHKIPEGWMLVLAGNPSEYNSSAKALDAVTADRMRMLWLKPDFHVWEEYVSKNHIHPIVLSYLNDHRGSFYVFEKTQQGTGLVTARAWEDLSVMIHMMEENKFPIDLAFISQYIQDSNTAREFFTYYQQYCMIIESGLPTAILDGKINKTQQKKLDSLSFGEKWALTSILMLRIENLCRDGVAEGVILEKISNAILFCRDHFEDSQQYEFLINGLTNSSICAEFLIHNRSEVYREALQDLYVSDTTPSIKASKALLKNAG